MSGFENDVIVGRNLNFNQNGPKPHLGILNVAGLLPIGTGNISPVPEILAGSLVSTIGTLKIGYSSPNITIDVSGNVGTTITGNSGGPLSPALGNWNILTANSNVKFVGSGSTLTQDFGATTNLLLGASGTSLSSGASNIGVGFNALSAISSGLSNTAIGYTGLATLQTGNYNVSVGNAALSNCGSSVGANVAIGYNSMINATGSNNVGVGYGTMGNVSGTNNVAIGLTAAQNLTSGGTNTCVGYSAGASLSSNSDNTFIGAVSGFGSSSGIQNTALGSQSYYNNVGASSGSGNVFVGFGSGLENQGGSYNTGVGYSTLGGGTASSATYCIGIGYNSGISYTTTEASNICIGHVGVAAESNVMRIGTTGSGTAQVNKTFIAGITGVTSSNAQMVTINSSTGQLGVSTVLLPGTTTNFATSAAPAGTTSTAAYVMLGLGSSWKLTPLNYGRVRLHINGQLANNTTGDGINVIIAYGTGTAPVNGAAVTGTTAGINTIFTDLTGLLTNGAPFSKEVIITGLTLSTAYWFDLQFKAVTGGTASVINAEFVAQELQY